MAFSFQIKRHIGFSVSCPFITTTDLDSFFFFFDVSPLCRDAVGSGGTVVKATDLLRLPRQFQGQPLICPKVVQLRVKNIEERCNKSPRDKSEPRTNRLALCTDARAGAYQIICKREFSLRCLTADENRSVFHWREL